MHRLQVAQKHMPAGSVIIGVDLQEIRPIRDVITFSDDITKPSCIRTILGHLKNTKVDVYAFPSLFLPLPPSTFLFSLFFPRFFSSPFSFPFLSL